MTNALSLEPPVMLSGALLLACVSCGKSEAAPLADDKLFRYSGKFVTHVEQPESVADCGGQYITYDASGFLSMDRSRQIVRLEGFGCTLGVEVTASSAASSAAQPCVVDGPVSFRGVGIDELRFETFEMDLNARSTSWRARASRNLPSGRVSYCCELTGSVESR